MEEKLETKRKLLDEVVMMNNFDLLNDKVLEISREMDELINRYILNNAKSVFYAKAKRMRCNL